MESRKNYLWIPVKPNKHRTPHYKRSAINTKYWESPRTSLLAISIFYRIFYLLGAVQLTIATDRPSDRHRNKMQGQKKKKQNKMPKWNRGAPKSKLAVLKRFWRRRDSQKKLRMQKNVLFRSKMLQKPQEPFFDSRFSKRGFKFFGKRFWMHLFTLIRFAFVPNL